MALNEQETRFHLIDPILRDKGYHDRRWLKCETPAPVEPTGFKGRRKNGSGRTDYLFCVQVGAMPKPLPVAVFEAKKEDEDPLKGMEQAKRYSECKKFEVKYCFASNGHLYGEYDYYTSLQAGPDPLADFLTHDELTARYAKDSGINLSSPEASILFQPDSPPWSRFRYYQDAAIRAAFEKILAARQRGEAPRVLLSLATGAGKTIIATNLLWRLAEGGQLQKPALFLCDRDELRGQAYEKLSAAFGSNVRIVKTDGGENAARNARIHIATYQTLGIDEGASDTQFASFLSEHYADDAFSIIIIDECHRSAWGRWSEVLKRNPNAIHLGLTATPRKLKTNRDTAEDEEITANNERYFGKAVYEYTLAQAQEDGYLAACEIVKRKPDIDKRVFTRQELLEAKVTNIKTGKPLTAEDLTKSEYTGADFDDEVFIDARTPAMCTDLFAQLVENGGPEQKVIIFCNREIHADRVVMYMNNLYAGWCKETGTPKKDLYAFKCMGGPNGGADNIEPMRGSGNRAFIACTVDLLEAGVDIERLNAVVFFRYLKSAIKFYQMVGRGTRIHEETRKYKFWLYDYTGVTDLFGTEFISAARKPSEKKSGGGYNGGEEGGGNTVDDGPSVGYVRGHSVQITPQGRFILGSRGGREEAIPIDVYRAEVVERVTSEAGDLDEFRRLWIETQKRQSLIQHILDAAYSPQVIQEIDHMADYDLFDFFGHAAYKARALTRAQRGEGYISGNAAWFGGMEAGAATVLKALGYQFAQDGTDALEKQSLWQVPEIKAAGGIDALKVLGAPGDVMKEAKGRLFGV